MEMLSVGDVVVVCPTCRKRSSNLSWIGCYAPILRSGLHCQFSGFALRLTIRWFGEALQVLIKLVKQEMAWRSIIQGCSRARGTCPRFIQFPS